MNLPIEITKSGQTNNGSVEISELEALSAFDKVPVDEVFINGRRYRVPERIIKLDFWSRVYKERYRGERWYVCRAP